METADTPAPKGDAVYALLRRLLSPLAADLTAAAVYALMIATIVYCAFEPQAEFSYLMF